MTKILIGRGDTDLDYPICRPSLDLDFTQEVLDSRITFTRGSIGTRVNRNRVIETVAANQPRFDYDPVTGECKGLLIEESRSNLYKNNTFQNVVVGNPGTAPTNTYTFIAPSGISREIVSTGTENGITYIDIRYSGVTKTAGELSFAQSSISVTGGQVVTASAYLKVVGGSFSNISSLTIRVLDYNGASYITESSSVAFSSYASGTTLQRYSHTRTTNASANSVIHSISLNGQSGVIDVTLRIGMPQLEVGSFTTSVIPTTANTTVTRSADLARITGTNFSSWYNSSEGTLYAAARINALGANAYPGIVYVDDGTLNNCIGLVFMDASNDDIASEAYVSGLNQYFLGSSSAVIPNQLTKGITAYQQNNFAAAFSNRTSVRSDRNGVVPTVNRMIIGDLRGGNGKLNGTISRLTYYPRRLKDNQLQMLTQ